jgi:hypothetical protein
MPAASIGSAALTLSANGAALQSGLDNAYARIQGWKQRVSASMGQMNISGMLSSFGAPGKIAGGAFAVLTGGGKLFSDAVKTINDLSKVGKQAQSIGVASDQFMGLGAAVKRVGIDTDTFTARLARMSSAISDGTPAASEALKKLGLDAANLKGMSPDKQLLTIADAFKNTGDQGAKASAAQHLFGKSFVDMMPVLSQGGAALQAFIDKQKEMGNALSNKDMDAVQKAKAAMPKIEAAFSGLWNKTVVAMAPLIEIVGTALSKIVAKLQPVFDWIARADKVLFGVYGAAIGEIIDAIGDAIGAVGDWAKAIFDFGGEWPEVGDVVMKVLQTIAEMGATVADVTRAAIGAVAKGMGWIGGKLLDLRDAIKTLIRDTIPEDLMPDFAKKLLAADDMATAVFRDLCKGMENWGERQMDAIGNWTLQTGEWFKKLRRQKQELDKDFIGPPVPQQQAAFQYHANTALEFGTSADLSARIRFEQEGVDIQKDIKKATEATAENTKKVADLIAKTPGLGPIGYLAALRE